MKAPRHANHRKNVPLPPLSRHWEGVTMDFITHLPQFTTSGYMGILVIIDRLTKMAFYLPCRKDIDTPEMRWILFEKLICNRERPDTIVTDRTRVFTSRFWNPIWSHLSINHRLSTTFQSQTNGPTERKKDTMEKYLWAFPNYQQDNWVELLQLAEFANNNSVHHSTRMTPFWANYHYHQQMQFKRPKAPSNLTSEILADAMVTAMEENQWLLRVRLSEAQALQWKYAGGMDVTFTVANKVWLSTRHFRTRRTSMKSNYKSTGPYTVSKISTNIAYNLDLLKAVRNHNIFQVSRLYHHTPPGVGQPSFEPPPVIVHHSVEW
jgi:hypothetical protein